MVEKAPFLRSARIGIYTGGGSSHSWLWFVDVFERLGLWDLCFLDEAAINEDALRSIDVLAVSGGDTFALAESLGRSGAEALRRFVCDGGLYIGSCAGAYLVMPSSKAPLNNFNLVNVKIANLAKSLPPSLKNHDKFFVQYGCSYVFHPVREEVRLRLESDALFQGEEFVKAPLFGGPAMLPSEDGTVIASYHSFTEKTVFLTDEEICRNTLIEKAAIVRSKLGKGCLYLFGPHLEHPLYKDANLLVGRIIAAEKSVQLNNNIQAASAPPPVRSSKDLRRQISNARIVAGSMEFMPVKWLIGCKVYEPEKIRVFLEAMWRRLRRLERAHLSGWELDEVISKAARIVSVLRRMHTAIGEGRDATHLAAELFPLLRECTSSFFSLYFKTLRSTDIGISCDRGHLSPAAL